MPAADSAAPNKQRKISNNQLDYESNNANENSEIDMRSHECSGAVVKNESLLRAAFHC